MDALVNDFNDLVFTIQTNLDLVLTIIGIIWGVYFVNNLMLGGALNILGLIPRSFSGLFGIFFSPFLHANFNHVFFNSIPLFALMNLVLLDSDIVFYIVTSSIVFWSGLFVWLLGRKAIHIGASGLILGYWSYCLFEIPNKGAVQAIVLGIVCIYQFGTLAMELVPSEKSTSWEGHLYGFISGIMTAYLLPYYEQGLVKLLT